MSPILEVRGLSVRYGGVRALADVTIDVREGEVLGLIGPNGAGKTTLFECIAGYVAPGAGSVHFRGEDITTAAPERRAQRGLIRSFQDARLFDSLTVFQTVVLAHEKHRPTSTFAAVLGLRSERRVERAKAEAAEALIDTMGLGGHRDALVSELSTGTRRICELACVLALDPVLLLLDEPSSGIAQREVEALGQLLRRIKDRTGCTMLVIEHDMPLITGLADRIVALESGAFLAEGTPAEIVHDPRVVESYLGGDLATVNRSGTPATESAKPTTATDARSRRARPLVASRAASQEERP